MTTSVEKVLICLCLTISGIAMGAITCLIAEHEKAMRHYEAASILGSICHTQIEHHDPHGEFEELYYDVISNVDCHTSKVTKKQLEAYDWCFE